LSVLQGGGVDSQTGIGGAEALPGFVISTKDVWETLVRFGLEVGLPTYRVARVTHRLGVRLVADEMRPVECTPDVTLEPPAGGAILVDAKYKVKQPGQSIDSSDLYEGLAFIEAARNAQPRTSSIILIYPTPNENASTAFYRIGHVVVGDRHVIGVAVAIRGLSRRNGLARLGSRLGEAVRTVLAMRVGED
jgi:hypothetical protein